MQRERKDLIDVDYETVPTSYPKGSTFDWLERYGHKSIWRLAWAVMWRAMILIFLANIATVMILGGTQ